MAGLLTLVAAALVTLSLSSSGSGQEQTVTRAPTQHRPLPPQTVGYGSTGLDAAQLSELSRLEVPTLDEDMWEPAAIFNDGAESTTFEIAFEGGIFDSAYISTEGVLDPDTGLDPILDQVAADVGSPLIQNFDDGSNGDRVAGDGIYSRGGITASGTPQHAAGTHQRVQIFVAFLEQVGGGSQWGWIGRMPWGIGVVDTSQRGSAPTTQLSAAQAGPTISATSHAIFVEDDGTFLPTHPTVDSDAVTLTCRACEVLIDRFGDVFDFVQISFVGFIQDTPACECQAFHRQERNDVSGIGLDIFDNNLGPSVFDDGRPFNTFSDGFLRGVIFNKQLDASPLAHEIMHQWVLWLPEQLGLADGTFHYSEFNDVNGIMDIEILDANNEPADFVSNGDGSFRVVARAGEYNPTFAPMSLYLAGLLSPAEVAATNLLVGSVDLSNPAQVIPSGGIQVVTIDDVTAIEGPRTPSVASSPKSFTVGTIVFSAGPITEAERTFVTLALRHFEGNSAYDGFGSPTFNAATGGRGSVQTALPGLVIEEPPEEEPVEEEPVKEEPVEEEPDGGEILALNAGGQFLFWQFGPANAADVFGGLKIAWLFNPATSSWIAFNPILGSVNFPLVNGAVLWLVANSAIDIEV